MAVIIKKQATGKTSVQPMKAGKPDGVPIETEEVLAHEVSQEAMATVGLSLGYTKNLGNYESAKVSVSLHLPCEPVEARIDMAFGIVEHWVNKKMESIVEQLK